MINFAKGGHSPPEALPERAGLPDAPIKAGLTFQAAESIHPETNLQEKFGVRLSYETVGSCATRIDIEIEDGVIMAAEFINGCPGNTQAIAALVRGMEVVEAVQRLKGIACQGDTSCPDQLAKALEAAVLA